MEEIIQRIENVVLDANCSRWEDKFMCSVLFIWKRTPRKIFNNNEQVQKIILSTYIYEKYCDVWVIFYIKKIKKMFFSWRVMWIFWQLSWFCFGVGLLYFSF